MTLYMLHRIIIIIISNVMTGYPIIILRSISLVHAVKTVHAGYINATIIVPKPATCSVISPTSYSS